ncbi:hypothetical protein RM780_23785 [Streptomyces sp. DSM 44917]|uniref:Lipoprotein n=1 Tax=Streptomyces boetiae TaxID=3075541 RepID=A0ABU2LEF3_9ACTN|nr:hypothetical protein [Streptomyces sp. DSM 44917]MDT0309951.1 hypothetical protein [Streptomyces sp. DSM 44917]
MKRAAVAVAALALTVPLLAACNGGGRDCDSAPAPASGDSAWGGESVPAEQVAAPGRTSGGSSGGGGRGGGRGSGGGRYAGSSGGSDDCDD